MNLATQYADTVHETEKFVEFYQSLDPKVYEDMSVITEFSDEQAAIARVVYQTREEGGLEVPKDAAIFDVACGTGMLGRLL